MTETINHGVFGYNDIQDSLLSAVVNWQKKQHNWTIQPEWILFNPSVVTALGFIVQTFSKPGDSVLIQTPVYGPFHHTPFLNGRHIVEAPLTKEHDQYIFDIDVFKAAITPDTRIFILCNPHNPIGKVWTKAELKAMGQVCLDNNILVIADEIHQDLVLNKAVHYTPFASIDDDFAKISITCTAPSKTFNLAGLQTATIIVSDPSLRKNLAEACEQLDITQTNLFGLVACEAAYSGGEAWLIALKDYLRTNLQTIHQSIATIPEVRFTPADALYLAWLNFSGTGLKGDEVHEHLLNKAGLWLDRGLKFGDSGSGFARLNFGCPRATLLEALERIKQSFV